METREREWLLAQRLELFKAILGHAENQRGCIAARDPEGLSASLVSRQAAMDAVDELDRRLGAALPGEDGHAAEIRSLLRRVTELDAENRRAAGELAVSLTSGFREVGAQRSVMAYSPAVSNSKFVDREG